MAKSDASGFGVILVKTYFSEVKHHVSRAKNCKHSYVIRASLEMNN